MKRIAKFLGLGLAIALAFSLGAALIPASAGVQEWDTVNTPSWEDNVIVPGSDIYDFAVGPDGETIYAVGAIKGGDDGVYLAHYPSGVTGSFYVSYGLLTVENVSGDLANISADFEGWSCVLTGAFSSFMQLTWDTGDGYAIVSGEVTDDTMTFSGQLYLENGTLPADDDYEVDEKPICVQDNQIQPDTITITGGFEIDGPAVYYQPRVWKSTDAGVTWDDITTTVQDATNLPTPFFVITQVAVAPDDEEWLALAGHDLLIADDPMNNPDPTSIRIVASEDGGDNFSYAGDAEDVANDSKLDAVHDLAISPEVDDIHIIAAAGAATDLAETTWWGSVYRLDAGTWLTGSWEDTSFYDGWENGVANTPSWEIIATDFSKNFDIDDTILCLGWDGAGYPYLQSGTWDGSGGDWNDEAGFTEAVEITDEGEALRMYGFERRSLGLAVPQDYDGTEPGSRNLFIYVDAVNETTGLVGGYVFRVDDDSVSESYGPKGDPALASIDFYGDADTGKMMVGTYLEWDDDDLDYGPYGSPVEADCCAGVAVYHTVELDPCCPDWEASCKDPSGPYLAQVKYSPDGEKAYAITSGFILDFSSQEFEESIGISDESAFSVSLDDGVSWNQIGLIDTDIDWLSDVAVCPDCSVIYLSSVNEYECWDCTECEIEYGGWDWVDDTWVYEVIDTGPMVICEACNCDSVWRSYDNGDTWERVFHGDWTAGPGTEGNGELLLRLPCEDTEDCCTLYLGVQETDMLYYTRDCGQCWTQTPGTKIPIQDFAVAAENEVMVIDDDGYFSMSTQFGRRWSDEVDNEVGSGHVIESCCLDDLVVVAGYVGEPVAFSEDMGETWDLTDDLPGDGGYAHVACDPDCPGTIYAALEDGSGIFRTTIDSGEWDDLGAEPLYYYGIEVARTGGALYAAYYTEVVKLFGLDGFDDWYYECYTGSENCTGVARNLDPCDTACCGEEDWDYLEAGLNGIQAGYYWCEEQFNSEPSALRICGCLTMDTPSILWAIDWQDYDVTDGSDGTLWSYEDCTAKKAPELVSPVCGEDIPSEPCEGCTNVDINLCWTNICDACTYDIEIATDEDFTQTIGLYSSYWDEHVDLECYDPADCADPCFLIPNGALQAGTTYYWHVRVHGSETGENARSQWSETCSFNVMAGAGAGVSLLAPENGSTGIGIESIGFSWTGVGGATSYSFVLSPNSDLSGALASEELSGTAYTYTGMLDYATPYFWQVTAWKNGSELSTSDVGAFTTMDEPPPPPEPAPAPAPPPDIVIPAAEQITPSWIIACIAIGAALIVLVIVLVVRTRRP